MRYDGESEPERRARRAAGWTPVCLRGAAAGVTACPRRTGDQASASIAIAGSGDPCQVNRQVGPSRTLPTIAGLKHTRLVPPALRTLG